MRGFAAIVARMKTIRTRVASILPAILLTVACAPPQSAEGPGTLPELALQKDKPAPALAEHLLLDYFGSDIVDPPTVCVAQQGETQGSYDGLPVDDEVALIERFPQLAPLSRCTLTNGTWQDSESGEPAMVFDIHSFTCSDDTHCSGWAGYTAGSEKGEYAQYDMTYADGRWAFERKDRRLLAK